MRISNMVAIVIFIFSFVPFYSNAESDRNNPILLECNSCGSYYEFENKLRSAANRNSVDYYLVFNENTSEIYSALVSSIYEPEIKTNYIDMYQLSTLKKHQDNYAEHLNLLSYATPPPVLYINYPSSDLGGENSPLQDNVATYSSFARQHLLERNPFYARHDIPVVITFKSGHIVSLVLKRLSSGYILISIVDPNGNVMPLNGTSGGSGGGSGGSGSGSVSVIIPPSSGGEKSLSCSFENLKLTCKWV